ncbi:MAG: glycine betaine/L-proline ABC transporter ATP-binding protein [Chloroflexi bacterium]|nr:glycine betaine/L-proline ABC transporter ATP-binding protein [Chloroflexota bacterium]
MPSSTQKLSIRSLWKVFGPHADYILKSDWRRKSRAEVQKETGHVIALRDATFDVAAGETFVVMGLSGSGKSTLVRCLLRLVEPSQGHVLVDGEDILEYSGKRLIQFRRKKAGMVFQRFGLLPHRSVLDNVAFGLEAQGINKRTRLDRALEVLQAVGLEGWEHNMPYELSGGMQQRVGLARALAADPEILLMDEPFSALDPLIRRDMQNELMKLQERIKKTIVFITHDLDEALKLGNRIAIMRDGAIVQIGTPEEIVATPSDEYVSEFTRDVRKAAVLPVRSIMTPPTLRVYDWQGPRVVLHEMGEAKEELAFVVDRDERLMGVVTGRAIAEAAQNGVASIKHLMQEPPIVVSADSTIEALLAQLLDYDWRIEVLPVVGADDELVGEVHRASVREVTLASKAGQPAALGQTQKGG